MPITYKWLGGSGNWNVAGNWDQGKVPDFDPTGDPERNGPALVVIDTTGDNGQTSEIVTISDDQRYKTRSLTMSNSNATLLITGQFDVGNRSGTDVNTTLFVQSGQIVVDGGSFTAQYGLTSASGSIVIRNYGSYQWDAVANASGQTVTFQGPGQFTLSQKYNGTIAGFTSGDTIAINDLTPDVKNLSYDAFTQRMTITYNNNSTSTLQFAGRTYLQYGVNNGYGYISGQADPNASPPPVLYLQGVQGDGTADVGQTIYANFIGNGSNQVYTFSESVGGQTIIRQTGGSAQYTPDAADAGQGIDISCTYFDFAGGYSRTITAYAGVNSLPPIITAPGLTNNTRPAISGTGEVGAEVTLTIDNNVIDTSSKRIIVGKNGTWSYTPTFTLSEGKHVVTATQQGVAHASTPSEADGFAVDTTAPVVASVSLDKNVYKLGDTVTAKIQLSGPPDGNGNYTLGAGSTIAGTALTAGTYVVVNNFLTATFVVGPQTFEVINGNPAVNLTVKDAVGNTSGAITTPIAAITTIDTHAPTAVSVAGFSNGSTDTGMSAIASGSTVGTLSTTDASPGDSFTYSLTGTDAGLFEIVNGELRVGATNLTVDSVYSFNIVSRDLGGNSVTQAVQVTGAPPPFTDQSGLLAYTNGSTYDAAASVGEVLHIYAGPDTSYTVLPYDGVHLTISNGFRTQRIGPDQGPAAYNLDFSSNTAAVNLTGGAYNDVIRGGSGTDTLNGGGGNDIVSIKTTPAKVDGGTGTNLLLIGAGGSAVLNNTNFANFGRVTVLDGATLDMSAVSISDGGSTGLSIAVSGTSGASIIGTRGNDRIYGDRGADTLKGGGGDDTILIKTTPTKVDGGTGRNLLTIQAGGAATLTNTNFANFARVTALDGATLDMSGVTAAAGLWLTAYGTVGASITGTQGADRIFGDRGADTLNGGGGNDTITIKRTPTKVDGGAGTNLLYIDAGGAVTLSNSNFANFARVTVLGGASLDMSGVSAAATPPTGLSLAASGNTAVSIIGTQGDDRITGGSGADRLSGGAGNDTIRAGNGGATLIGGAGDDTLYGGAGVDTFDMMMANFGRDRVFGVDLTQDTFRLSTSFAADNTADHLHFAASGASDTLVYGDAGKAADAIILKGISVTTAEAHRAAFEISAPAHV